MEIEVPYVRALAGIALRDNRRADPFDELFQPSVTVLSAELLLHLGCRLKPKSDLLLRRQRHALFLSGHRVDLRLAQVCDHRNRRDDESDQQPSAAQIAASAASLALILLVHFFASC
jgi:hypothetical protein